MKEFRLRFRRDENGKLDDEGKVSDETSTVLKVKFDKEVRLCLRVTTVRESPDSDEVVGNLVGKRLLPCHTSTAVKSFLRFRIGTKRWRASVTESGSCRAKSSDLGSKTAVSKEGAIVTTPLYC
jgi:hypothetical protein